MRLQLLCFLLATYITVSHAVSHTEAQLKDYLANDYEKQSSAICTEGVQASWNYETDIKPENEEKVTETTLKSAKFNKLVYDAWFKDVDIAKVNDPNVKRMMRDLKLPGNAALNETDLKTLTEVINRMTSTYSSAKICPYKKQDSCNDSERLNLEPEIEGIISDPKSDYDQLVYVWKAWRDASGKKMRDDYKVYVDLSNKMAKLNGFSDYGDYWRYSFETDDFEKKLDVIWDKLKPFYTKLHHYASDKLKQRYGAKLDISDGLLPAHVLGNMWAQSWSNLDSLLKPYPNESVLDITQILKDQGYTPLKIFQTSDDFYTSLGLPSNNISYGSKSMIIRPDGKEVTCHASAWDFCDSKTFLIKMCTNVDLEDFITVHHEMGHIQYYQLYKDQPITFREGANPGFHEAVGDTIALSVQSIQHLKKINLLSDVYKETKESGINTLMSMALDKVVFMPFGFLIDKWRWDVFSGKVQPDQWNKHWWDLRKEYQLIRPPVERSESDFDPGAKFHVAADSQYVSYFVSHVLQFQFYRALCIEAGQYDPKKKSPPLHECDFYKSKEAGKLLTKGLSLGSSKPWPDVLEIMTGTRELDVNPLLEYFAPLMDHLGVEQTGSGPQITGSTVLLILSTLLFYYL